MAGKRQAVATAEGPGMDALGLVLDRISFERLEEQYPDLAVELEAIVSAGAGPAEVRRYALGRGMPRSWVAWLENSARWLTVAGGPF